MTTATMTRNGQMAQVSAWGSLYQMLMDALHGLDEAHERFAMAQAQATDAALTTDAAEQVYKDAAAADKACEVICAGETGTRSVKASLNCAHRWH